MRVQKMNDILIKNGKVFQDGKFIEKDILIMDPKKQGTYSKDKLSNSLFEYVMVNRSIVVDNYNLNMETHSGMVIRGQR